MADAGDESVSRALSAYMIYTKKHSAQVGEELRSAGKESSIAHITSLVADRFKSLSESERAPYDELAKKDKERYNRECEARDAEVLRQQEERRKSNNLTETDTRMRGSTLNNSETSFVNRESAKRPARELSAAEIKERDKKRDVKKQEEALIKGQHDTLKVERARQAEARLKYLLSQSDIFAHFGKGGGGGSSAAAAAAAAAGGGSSSGGVAASASSASLNSNTAADGKRSKRSRKGGKADAEDALDEDEAAIVAEVDEDEEEGQDGSKKKKKGTVLLKQPSIMTGGQLRDYQLEGLNWMIRLQENGINGILADEMGLGKTVQSISILAFMNQHLGIKGPHLIMVPKSTMSNWMNEFKRFCPSIRVIKFHGNGAERAEIAAEHLQAARSQESRKWDVCITTYEVVNLEKNVLIKLPWRYLIIDEAHRLKNEASQFSQTVRMLQTQYRLLLTGTPLQNNLHELWALLNFLLPDVFSSADQFDEWFDLDVDDVEAKQRIIGQLHKLLRPFMLRRLKADVEKSLLPKTETILFIGMSKEQKEIYKKVLLRDIDTVNAAGANEKDSKSGRTAVLNIVMQLRKCCNHPYLFPGIEDRSLDPLGEHLYQSCGKMVLLHRLLRKLYDRDHRVLIFSQMTRMLDILEDYLISQGYQYCRIDGNTTYDEREDRIQAFNKEGSEKFIFLLSTRAGGLGINLQTADTVILYDSDWNPQADLQAQDRAHRIGQKKAVQVFRLVTDETVEVKVVERAQQKLKLDAMVVQQGRLQEKEKKMTKQDLLETVRFGADKIFKANKESGISDADIDLILEEGRKRTDEMNAKLQVADKGDMYDFRLDGGMKTQEFDGVDYSDKSIREQERAFNSLAFIDTGKRDRKMVTTYAENVARQPKEGAEEGRPKMPRSMRLPKMEDWQFYNRERLNELQSIEASLFDQLVEKGELPQSTRDMQLLTPELQEEKNRLLDEGFSAWSKPMHNAFLKASARFGRNEYDKIARELQQPLDEITRYATKFWTDGPTVFDDWDNKLKNIEKGEKKIEEIQRLTTATADLIKSFDNPWDDLHFRSNLGNAGRMYTSQEDRFLLCLTHLHGYGNWDQVRSSIRRCPAFRFDFFLQTCTSEQLGKRCETLMKAAERELEVLKKRNESSGGVKKTPEEQSLETQAAYKKQLQQIARDLTRVRDQLQQAKSGHAANSKNPAPDSGAGGGSAGGGPVKEKKAAAGAGAGAAGGGAGAGGNAGGKRPFPDRDLPELCRTLLEHDTWGLQRLIDAWLPNHGDVSKRQLEETIKGLTTKEGGRWKIKPEYAHLSTMEASEVSSGLAATGASSPGAVKKPPAKKVKTDSAAAAGAGPDKRKRDEGDAADETAPDNAKERAPVKNKTAFHFFQIENKKQAEQTVSTEPEPELKDPAVRKDRVKKTLQHWFEELDAAGRAKYEQAAEEDKRRYEAEMAAYKPAVIEKPQPPAKKPKAAPKLVTSAAAAAAVAAEGAAAAAVEASPASAPAADQA